MTVLCVIVAILILVLAIPVKYLLKWHHPAAEADHELIVSIYWLMGLIRLRVQKGEQDHLRKSIRVLWFYEKNLAEKSRDKSAVSAGKFAGEQTKGSTLKNARKFFRRLARYFNVGEIKNIGAKAIRMVWKTLQPRAGSCTIEYGTGNPMYTGIITGLLHTTSIFRRFPGKFTPNFVNKTLTGECHIRGNIVLGFEIGRAHV